MEEWKKKNNGGGKKSPFTWADRRRWEGSPEEQDARLGRPPGDSSQERFFSDNERSITKKKIKHYT
jgi:hypothetical protein